MSYCERCGTQLHVADRFCPTCGAPVQRGDVTGEPYAAQDEAFPHQAQPPAAASARRPSGRALALAAGATVLAAGIAAGGLLLSGLAPWDDPAEADRAARAALPALPIADQARLPGRSRLAQLGKLPGSVVAKVGGQTGSHGDPAHVVLVSESSVSVVCGQIRRQWLSELGDQRFRADVDRTESLSGYLRGSEECAFAGEGRHAGRPYVADIIARRLSPTDPRLVAASRSTSRTLDSLATGGAPLFRGEYTEVELATDAPYLDRAAEAKRAAKEKRRRQAAKARDGVSVPVGPGTGSTGSPAGTNYDPYVGPAFQAELPSGGGWAAPAQTEPTPGRLFRTSVRGASGQFVIIDYTPYEPATFGGNYQSRTVVGHTAFGSATKYVFRGGRLPECQRSTCIDYFINDPSGDSGFGVLAGGPETASAELVARTVAESVVPLAD